MAGSHAEVAGRIVAQRLIAVVRADSVDAAVAAALATYRGGIGVLEIAFTTPDAASAIRRLDELTRDALRPPLLGAGTVLTTEAAGAAAEAGARFLVAPGSPPWLVATAHGLGVAALPGAATVTEILAALEAGADLVKIFPAQVLGVAFLKAVRTVLPAALLVPTGGIDARNVGAWLEAGASAVGVGGALTAGSPELVEERARELVAGLAAWRP